MNTSYTIASLTFREASRRKILLAAFLLGLAFLTIFGIGFYYMDLDMLKTSMNSLAINEMRNMLLMSGLYVVNFLAIMMAVLTSVDTLSGEITSGTIHTLVSKPVRRWELLLGKWIGFVFMLTLYLLLMAGGVIAIVHWISGYSAPNWLHGLGLLWLNGVLLLSVSFLGGAMFSTLANGVMVFGLYGIAFIGGWVEQIGSFLHNQTTIYIGIISSLIIPSEALWKRAAFEMQSPWVGVMGFSPFSAPSVPSPIMIGYAGLYTLVALALAIHKFNHRDL